MQTVNTIVLVIDDIFGLTTRLNTTDDEARYVLSALFNHISAKLCDYPLDEHFSLPLVDPMGDPIGRLWNTTNVPADQVPPGGVRLVLDNKDGWLLGDRFSFRNLIKGVGDTIRGGSLNFAVALDEVNIGHFRYIPRTTF